MTNYVVPVPGTSYMPSGTGSIASNMAMPGIWSDENGVETIPGQPDQNQSGWQSTSSGGTSNTGLQNAGTGSLGGPVQQNIPGIPDPSRPVLPENPQFQVPPNPLLPPGYQEMLSYENLQYMNGFLRTQIGKYLRVEQLVTSSQIEDRFGYLVGVGLNYILLQQPGTGNISAVDYYSIKYVYVYYNQSEVPMG
ncbi:MAG: hypothetical protein IKJ77_09230 [Firmicutes bacterium]|nr:hypothetical protein [Bacillota bacterium]